jgi:hypothetical protein
MPKTLNTFVKTALVAWSTSGSAQPQSAAGSQARSRRAFDAPMIAVAIMNSPLAIVVSNLYSGSMNMDAQPLSRSYVVKL